ncbi:hypothetical protein AVEN_154647-1 [Araneus ventricosus]|uniref:Uncharacterized protein n=1 Tax=Araneus ventricosus TaxID=182803 RepID=A0A4Y2JML3_ARAVE|nr:hypothetical protein AVEN_154647-1 [Araneus ventricosus]
MTKAAVVLKLRGLALTEVGTHYINVPICSNTRAILGTNLVILKRSQLEKSTPYPEPLSKRHTRRRTFGTRRAPEAFTRRFFYAIGIESWNPPTRCRDFSTRPS